MNGCRPLTEDEIRQVLDSLSGKYATRNRTMFVLGLRTGYRIQEILSLTVGDVYKFGHIVDRVSVARRHMKGKNEARVVPLHAQAKEYLKNWILERETESPILDSLAPLFPSRKGCSKPITGIRAWQILKDAYNQNQMTGKLGTHSMRKTFAGRVYSKLDHDLVKTQRAMGHAKIDSTARYIVFDDQEITDAIME